MVDPDDAGADRLAIGVISEREDQGRKAGLGEISDRIPVVSGEDDEDSGQVAVFRRADSFPAAPKADVVNRGSVAVDSVAMDSVAVGLVAVGLVVSGDHRGSIP